MKRLKIISLAITILFCGCVSNISPDEESVPVAEGVKDSEVGDYRVKHGKYYGSLIPGNLDLSGKQVFLSDYPIDLLFENTLELDFVLATPDDTLYQLEAVDNLDEILAWLGIDSRTGTFIGSEEYNAAGCQVPADIETPEDVYCGFQFEDGGITYVILVLGTTERDLKNPDKEPTRITTLP